MVGFKSLIIFSLLFLGKPADTMEVEVYNYQLEPFNGAPAFQVKVWKGPDSWNRLLKVLNTDSMMSNESDSVKTFIKVTPLPELYNLREGKSWTLAKPELGMDAKPIHDSSAFYELHYTDETSTHCGLQSTLVLAKHKLSDRTDSIYVVLGRPGVVGTNRFYGIPDLIVGYDNHRGGYRFTLTSIKHEEVDDDFFSLEANLGKEQ